jgi:50S ribosomal subunit-associated GTPase HflX
LLHVVDASDKFVQERINVVNKILDDIWAKQPRVLIFNKLDICTPEKIAELHKTYDAENPLRISIWKEEWLETIKERLMEFFAL